MGYFDDNFEEIIEEQYKVDQAAEAKEVAKAKAQEQANTEAKENSQG